MIKIRPYASETVKAVQPEELSVPPLEGPRLLWPSVRQGAKVENHDLARFPDMTSVECRHMAGAQRDDGKRELHLELNTFVSAVAQAEKRLFVLDPHFDEVGVDAIGSALATSSADDIRLLTGNHKGKIEEWRRTLEDFRNMERPVGSKAVEVKWYPNLDSGSFPFLHDRFAVVDGALWHFGATVGGGHPGLTAASGPWPEQETRGKHFFEECWWRLHARPNHR